MKTFYKTKSILLSIIILCMAAFASCSKSDDNNPEPPDDREQLVLSVSKTAVVVNEMVTFTITANGNTVTDAEVYLDDNPINSMTWRFSARGTYTVTAKKDGYKDSEPQTITVTEPVKITATQMVTAPRSPALGTQGSRMCYGGQKIYTFDRANEKFMSYDPSTQTWTTLAHSNQLAYAGYDGKMIYREVSDLIYYFDSWNKTYQVSANSWKPNTYIDNAFAAGEAGYVYHFSQGRVFSAGGRMSGKNSSTDIRKYNPNTDVWEKIADMPVALTEANATLVGSKMYIIGEKEDGTKAGVIFDTDALTVKNWAVPEELYTVRSYSYQMAVYNNYLFYNNSGRSFYAYNMETGKWIDAEIIISGDFLSGSTNLLIMNSNFYAAGEKDGNFALYKLTVSLQ